METQEPVEILSSLPRRLEPRETAAGQINELLDSRLRGNDVLAMRREFFNKLLERLTK